VRRPSLRTLDDANGTGCICPGRDYSDATSADTAITTIDKGIARAVAGAVHFGSQSPTADCPGSEFEEAEWTEVDSDCGRRSRCDRYRLGEPQSSF
jgi:hypothetical protein